MNADKIAVNKRTALKMFWDAGLNTEQGLISANQVLYSHYQPSQGYWYAEDVVKMVENFVDSVENKL